MKQPSNIKVPSEGLLVDSRREMFGLAAFFLLFFLYIWLRIQPSVELHVSGRLFFLTQSFASPFLNRAGGPLEYGAAFLAQFSYCDWVGALIFSGLALLLVLATRRMLRFVSGTAPGIALLVLPFLLLLSRNLYDGRSLNILLGSLLAVATTVAWLLCRSASRELRVGIGWAAAAALFYIGGLWPCLLFAVMAALAEILRGRNWGLGLACVAPGLAGVIWVLQVGGGELGGPANPWGGGPSLAVATLVYLFFPAAALAQVLAERWPVTKQSPTSKGRKGAPADRVPRRLSPSGLRKAATVGGFMAGCVLVWLLFEGQRKVRAEIDCYAWRGDHQKVLAAARRLKVSDTPSDIRVQWALYQSGRLLEDLFSFPVQISGKVLPGLSAGAPGCRAQVEPLLELGLVNDAEHYAHEALEWEGNRADLLLALAKVNILKGRPCAASVFLNVLLQVPFQGETARDYVRPLSADANLAANKKLCQIRSCMPAGDVAHGGLADSASLQEELLRSNHLNKMAFEYMTAQSLLSLDLNKLVAELWRLDDLGYASIPRHYEEALLLYQRRTRIKVELRGRQFRSETIARFQLFSEAMDRRAYDTEEGRAALTRDFGDTYWYYFLREKATRRPDTRETAL